MMRPRLRSAKASEAMNQFWTRLRLCSVAMAMMTSILPTTTTTIISVIRMASTMIWGGVYWLGKLWDISVSVNKVNRLQLKAVVLINVLVFLLFGVFQIINLTSIVLICFHLQ